MKQDREQTLKSRLSVVNKLTLTDAMELLGSSESTVRRMFSRLEKEGFAIRVHGGIQRLSSGLADYSFEHVAQTNLEKKTAIAKEACHLLRDGDIIFCDSGTTIQCFCVEMVEYLRKNNLRIKVYTNSLANLELLSPHMQVWLIGGEYRANRKDFCGYLSNKSLEGLRFDKCFVGADGCVDGRLFTTTDFETASMNEIAIANSRCTIMLTDASKFSASSHVSYVTADKLQFVITDSTADSETLKKLRQHAGQVICAAL